MYVYLADTWCDSCGEQIRRNLDRIGRTPEDPEDERSFDSDEYPKHALEEDTDYVDHCAGAGECLEGIDLGDYGLPSDATLYGAETRIVGAILSSGLTDMGVRMMRDVLAERDSTPFQAALRELWLQKFEELA